MRDGMHDNGGHDKGDSVAHYGGIGIGIVEDGEVDIGVVVVTDRASGRRETPAGRSRKGVG